MNRDDIRKVLIQIPAKLGIKVENESVQFILDGKSVIKNMQTDEAAFEGWALMLKNAYPQITILLTWNIDEGKLLRNEKLHYNRFLFRVSNFLKLFDDWFSIAEENRADVSAFENLLGSPVVVNSPQTTSNNKKSNLEHDVECSMVGEKKDKFISLLKEHGIVADRVYNQLPCGLFSGKVSKETAIFTGQKSCFDIWALGDNVRAIFELKVNNKKVGIVSELLAYAFMWRMFYCGGFFPEKYKDVRGFRELVDYPYPEVVQAYFLTNGVRTGLKLDEICGLLNQACEKKNIGIKFGNITYDLQEFTE